MRAYICRQMVYKGLHYQESVYVTLDDAGSGMRCGWRCGASEIYTVLNA